MMISPDGLVRLLDTERRLAATLRKEPRMSGRYRATGGWLMGWEAAEILHVSPKTVARWAKEGKLPYSRTLGRHRRYKEADIRALVDHHDVTDPRR